MGMEARDGFDRWWRWTEIGGEAPIELSVGFLFENTHPWSLILPVIDDQ